MLSVFSLLYLFAQSPPKDGRGPVQGCFLQALKTSLYRSPPIPGRGFYPEVSEAEDSLATALGKEFAYAPRQHFRLARKQRPIAFGEIETFAHQALADGG